MLRKLTEFAECTGTSKAYRDTYLRTPKSGYTGIPVISRTPTPLCKPTSKYKILFTGWLAQWRCSSQQDSSIYQTPFRRDHKEKEGGGILVYVKNGVQCKRRPDLENEQLECIWLEVKPIKSKPFLVGQIYRPPSSGITWDEIFEEGIENVLKEEKEMYLIGDINRDLLNCQIKKSWSDYIEPFGLTQLVSEATRVTSVSKTLIDLIYSNCPENVTSIDVPKIGLSDHFPIFFTRKMHVQPPKGKHNTISYRSFKNLMKLNL